MTQVIYLYLGWTEGNFADIVVVTRKNLRLTSLHPLRKMQNCSFAAVKPSQGTQGLSLQATSEFTPSPCSLRSSCAASQQGCVGETETGDCCEFRVLCALSP